MAATTIDEYLEDVPARQRTIRFQPDHPIPEDLVTRMVKARIDQVSG